MGELIEFPTINRRKSLTATGRFLLAVSEQEDSEERALAQRRRLINPTAQQCELAKKELDIIFSGENYEYAQKFYEQGKFDVVHNRKPTEEREIYFVFPNDHIARKLLLTTSSPYTDAALFYIHIENLITLAASKNDQPSVTTNQVRLNRLNLQTQQHSL